MKKPDLFSRAFFISTRAIIIKIKYIQTKFFICMWAGMTTMIKYWHQSYGQKNGIKKKLFNSYDFNKSPSFSFLRRAWLGTQIPF